MTPEIRTKLHTLLDQMIDEDKPIGQVDEITTKEVEGKYMFCFASYQLQLKVRSGMEPQG